MTTQSKNTSNASASNASANSDKGQKTDVGQILAQSKKEVSGQSAYGATVNLICNDLSLLSDRDRLIAKLKEAGINTNASKNAIQTGLSQTRNVVSKLHQNGYFG